MTDLLTTFWDKRVTDHGHTGWADTAIYAFDQTARLKTIAALLHKHGLSGNLAFDFGCGTGDFSQLLSAHFKNVIGYDLSTQATNKALQNVTAKNVTICDGNYTNIPIKNNSINLILSMTVLDHVTDDHKLNNILSYFHQKLSLNGHLLLMEYAPDTVMDEINNYQRFDLYTTWKQRLQAAGFNLIKTYGFHQPVLRPSKSFLNYKNSLQFKFWSLLSRFRFAQNKIKNFAAAQALRANDMLHENSQGHSLKIMLLIKH